VALPRGFRFYLSFQKNNPSAEYFEVGRSKASKLVFCEGVHIRNNPWFQWVKMAPVKGELILIHAPSLSEELILDKKVFVLPFGNQRFKVGSTYEWSDLTEIPTENGKLSITERLDKVIDCAYEIENQWAGVRPATVDRRPVLGAHPEYKNLFVFNGLGTKGVMLAPYFAREMLSMLTIKNFMVHAEVTADRFLNKNVGI
jgi:glycine oxidase